MTPADLASLSNAVAADSDATKPRSGEWFALRRAASEAAKALSYALKEAARRGERVDESRYVVGIHPQAALRLVLDVRGVTEAATKCGDALRAVEWAGEDEVGEAGWCPSCWCYRDKGHTPDCALAAALGVMVVAPVVVHETVSTLPARISVSPGVDINALVSGGAGVSDDEEPIE